MMAAFVYQKDNRLNASAETKFVDRVCVNQMYDTMAACISSKGTRLLKTQSASESKDGQSIFSTDTAPHQRVVSRHVMSRHDTSGK